MHFLRRFQCQAQNMHGRRPFLLEYRVFYAGMTIALYKGMRGSWGTAWQHAAGELSGGAKCKGEQMFRKTLGIAAATALAAGLLAVGPVAAAQTSSTPCAVPGEGPRDGSGQGQGLRDGAGNGPRNGQGYGPKRGQAQGLRDGSGTGRGMKQGGGRATNR